MLKDKFGVKWMFNSEEKKMGEHLTYFKVENFKKFDSLEVKDIGQFNLITGDNNVGKTCLLEALMIDNHAKTTLACLYYSYRKRGIDVSEIEYKIGSEEDNFKKNLIGLSQKDINKPIKINKKFETYNSSYFEIENKSNFNPSKDQETKKFVTDVDLFQYKGLNQLSKNWLVFKYGSTPGEKEIKFLADINSSYYKEFYTYSDYFPLIKIDRFHISVLIESQYVKVFNGPEEKQRIISIVNEIFPDLKIVDIELRKVFAKKEISFATIQRPFFHSIGEYGDGVIGVLRILIEILFNKGNIIFLDEIEIGIHHTKMKNFWNAVLQIAQKEKVQIFATTHNKECAQAYVEAAKELNENIQKELRLIELYERNDKIFAGTVKEIDGIEYSVQYEPFRGEDIYA